MSFLMTVFGYLALAVSLAGVAFGVFMAASSKTRDTGKYFALWWVPGAAAASGIIMRDIVTFTIGFACFCVAGVVFAFEARASGGMKRSGSKTKKKRATRSSENTTTENEKRNYRRRAS
ncbi:MAG: hypothetical protein M3494_16770 [Actinomycetota bacterium]|nr:hypothetical protein [Actinomycetota bacterium]